MIDGVELLYTEIIEPNIGNIIAGCVIVIGGVLLAIIGVWLLQDNIENSLGRVLFFVGFCFVLVCGIFVIQELNVNDIHYKVKINEEVKFKEFTDRYEVINQEGEIWTIREIENK